MSGMPPSTRIFLEKLGDHITSTVATYVDSREAQPDVLAGWWGWSDDDKKAKLPGAVIKSTEGVAAHRVPFSGHVQRPVTGTKIKIVPWQEGGPAFRDAAWLAENVDEAVLGVFPGRVSGEREPRRGAVVDVNGVGCR